MQPEQATETAAGLPRGDDPTPPWWSWVSYRVFSTVTLGAYIIVFSVVYIEEAMYYTSQAGMWALGTLLTFRHQTLGMTLGYHRLYSHTAYRAQRWFECLIAYSCAVSGQGAISWWAGNHRHHHAHCETAEDPHSPVMRPVWYAWIGWTYDPRHARRCVRLRYPEVVWLDRWGFLMPWLEWSLVLGLSGSVVFATYTTLLPAWISILFTLWFNIQAHRGVPDEKGCAASTHWLAYALGEWQHRDHHLYPGKARRSGADLPYWLVLWPMQRLGVVWDLRER